MISPERIFLVGFSGCGKTTHGKKLATLYNYHFIDTDWLFKERYQTSVLDFFKNHGEAEFREKEYGLLQEVCFEKQAVIALGGGTPCYKNAMDLIRQSGVSIYIKMSEDSIFKRLKDSKNVRPLMLEKNDDELKQFIENALKERSPIYESAHIIIKGENLEVKNLKTAIDYLTWNQNIENSKIRNRNSIMSVKNSFVRQ